MDKDIKGHSPWKGGTLNRGWRVMVEQTHWRTVDSGIRRRVEKITEQTVGSEGVSRTS